MRHFLIRSTLASIFAMMLGGNVHATSYTFEKLQEPGEAGLAFPSGVNNSGEVVGQSGDHGFLYVGGSYTKIMVSGAWSTSAIGVSNNSRVVGYYYSGENFGHPHGFVWEAGSYSDINVPGAMETYPTGINSSGEVVGGYYDSQFYSHGFIEHQGVFTTFDVPGAAYTSISSINDSGTLFGWSSKGNFTVTNGILDLIDFPGAYGINDQGQLVGAGDSTGLVGHGAIYTDGVFQQFDVPVTPAPPGATLGVITTIPSDLNDSGQIVGYFYSYYHYYIWGDSFDNDNYTFIATPIDVPEPSSFIPLFTGLAAIGLLVALRKRCSEGVRLPKS